MVTAASGVLFWDKGRVEMGRGRAKVGLGPVVASIAVSFVLCHLTWWISSLRWQIVSTDLRRPVAKPVSLPRGKG